MPDRPLVKPADRGEWRAWLEIHGDESGGIWLAVGKKGNRVTDLTYDDALEEALCFGWIDSTVRRLDDDRFKQLFTPRRAGSTWSRSNKERVARLTEAGLMRPAGLAVIERAKEDGTWTLLDEVEDLIVPDDFRAALEADSKAARFFEDLSDFQKKQILYWVQTAKRADTRAKRIAETVASAREGRMPR